MGLAKSNERTWRRSFLKSTTVFPRPELPLIVFGCEFHSSEKDRNLGVCKTCGLAGKSGETLTCRLAETWAKGEGHFGKGHFGYARARDDNF